MANHYTEADCDLVQVRNNFLLPTAKLDDQKFEFYFLVDLSGSMHGRPFDLACRAILLFVQSLPEDCYFNVIGFHDTYVMLFPETRKYSQAALEETRQVVPGWSKQIINGGSDNIYVPLRSIYQNRQKPGYLTQIFTMTDGNVQSLHEEGKSWRDVVDIVKSQVKYARNFALGIGNGVNRDFVQQMASNSGGLHDFVDCSDKIESQILRMLKVSLQPALLKPIRDASQSRLIPMYELDGQGQSLKM